MTIGRSFKCVLAGAACALALAGAAAAQTRDFTVPGGDLKAALDAYARQAGVQIIYRTEDVRGARSGGVHGAMSAQEALNRILAGTAFQARQDSSGAVAVVRAPPSPPRPPAGTAASEAESSTQLAEVVVTAQKRSERLLSTPAPVTALLAATLQRQEAMKLSDYAAKVPGMNYFSDQTGELQIIMRGVTTGSVSSSTTGVYIDGAPFSPSTNYQFGGLTQPDLDPGSLQRIEVLRGPQGTLYGASSLGGLISFVSIAPSLTRFSGRAEVDASVVDGGGAGFGARAMVDGPIVPDKLGFTISGYVRRDPGFIDNPILGLKNVNDDRVDGGRAALLWTPTPDLSIELSALLHDSYSDASSDEDLDANLRPIGGGLKQYRYAPATFDIQDRLYIGHIDYTLPGGKLTSVTSYQTLKNIYDTDYTDYFGPLIGEIFGVDNPGALLDSVEHRDKLSEELRLASTGDQRLEWQGGFFFTHENSTNPQVLTAFDTATRQPIDLGDLAHFMIISHYTEYAGFGDLTYHFTPQLSLLAGLRYGYNRQTFREPTSGLFAGGTNLAVGTSSDSSVTWLVAPQYKISADQLLYARVATGYRPGGPNDVNPAQIAAGAPQTFKPDTLTNYELGYKAALLDRRVTLDLSAFDIEWKDIQMINVVDGLGFTGNGQSARSRGVEAAATWTPRQGLTLSANAAWTDAYLTADAPTVGGKAGDRLPYVPKFAANIGADYDFPISDRLSGFVGADIHYQGDRTSAFVVGAPAGFQPPVMGSYATLDLRAGVTRGGVEVEAYVKNLNDSGGLNTINSLEIDGVSAPLAAAVLQPRTFGMSVTSKF